MKKGQTSRPGQLKKIPPFVLVLSQHHSFPKPGHEKNAAFSSKKATF